MTSSDSNFLRIAALEAINNRKPLHMPIPSHHPTMCRNVWHPFILVVLGALLISGCAQNPSSRLSVDDTRSVIELLNSRNFRHFVVLRNTERSTGRLHVYLEGDGTPWVNGGREVAQDPTPRLPLALHLMRQDPASAVYLGRPCYHGHANDAGCSPYLWTHGRYSEQVVTSMVEILQALIEKLQVKDVVMIGYSGGGTLARLLAGKIPETTTLVTVAGLHDIQAWTRLHGYLPLNGSLNPARQPLLSEHVRQVHYFGGRDHNVPPSLIPADLPGEHHILLEFDHVCCWEENWPQLLRQVIAPGEISRNK